MHYIFKFYFIANLKYLNLDKVDENKNYIYVCNHQSFFDAVIMGLVFPRNSYIIAKDSLKYVPYFGWLYTLSGNFYIKRGNSEKAKQTLNRVIQKIKTQKSSIFILPQGTRAKNNQVTKLKRGFVQLAKSTQTDILPLVISTYSLKDLLFNFRNKKPIYMKILDKIDYKKSEDDLMAEVKNLMTTTIKELDAMA